MLQSKRDFFVSRINAGFHRIKVRDLVLNVFPPSQVTEYEACEIYNEVYDEAYESGLLSVEESYEVLIERGLWTDRNEKDLKLAPENIETLKMELYRAAFKSNTRAKVREKLALTKLEHERLLAVKNCLVPYTCAGLANYAKWNHIVEHSTFMPNGTKYCWDTVSLHHVMAEYNGSILTPDELRELARTDPWSSMWVIKKKNGHIFNEPWSIEQKTLINWSILYDSVYESGDAPGSDIVEDDDMLDGWLIIKRKEREHEQAKKQGEEAITQNQKIANSAEIFVPVETPSDVKKVQDMNDAQGRATYKARLSQIAKEGTVKHGDLKDVAQEVSMKRNQAYLEKMRKI